MSVKRKSQKSGPRSKFISPVGWYLAAILVRFEWYDEDKLNRNRRCKAWENQLLIKAASPEEAYAKAVKHGKDHELKAWEAGNVARKGRWRFEGLTSLVAIDEELEDGAEISWSEFENRSVRKVQSWAKRKRDLEVFNRILN